MSEDGAAKQLGGKALKDFLKRNERPPVDLAFLLQDVEDPVNVGAAFRIADACGVSEIVLTGLSPYPPDATIAGVGRGTHRRVPWSYTQESTEALKRLRNEGYTNCALEVSSNARPYDELAFPTKVCIVAGNEHHGVTKRALALCDLATFIPMYGKIRSLNVHVALAIVAFQIIHQHKTLSTAKVTSVQPLQSGSTGDVDVD